MLQTRAFKAGVLGSGTLLVQLSQLICAAALTRIFTKPDYADYRQTFLIFDTASPLLALGLPMALFYFLPRQPEKSKSFLTTNLILLAFTGLLFAAFIWFGGGDFIAKRFQNENLGKLLLIFSPFALLALPARSMNACLISCDKVKTLAVYNILSKSLFTISVIAMALIWATPQAAIGGAVISTFIVLLPALFLMYHSVPSSPWLPQKQDIFQQLKYSIPFGLAMLTGVLATKMDKLLVSDMTDPIQSAIYINGAMEIPLIEVITGSVMSILIPEFSRLFKDGNIEKITNLWHIATQKCALIIFPMMIFCFIMGSEIIQTIFPDEYAQSVHPFRVYLLVLPLRVTNFGAIFMAVGKNKLILYRSLIDLVVNLILSIIMIKMIGPIGAAIATVLVTYTLSVPFSVFFVSKILKISLTKIISFGPLLKGMLISLIAAVVLIPALWLKSWPDIIKLAVFGTFYSIAIIALFDIFGFIKTKDLINAIREKISAKL